MILKVTEQQYTKILNEVIQNFSSRLASANFDAQQAHSQFDQDFSVSPLDNYPNYDDVFEVTCYILFDVLYPLSDLNDVKMAPYGVIDKNHDKAIMNIKFALKGNDLFLINKKSFIKQNNPFDIIDAYKSRNYDSYNRTNIVIDNNQNIALPAGLSANYNGGGKKSIITNFHIWITNIKRLK